MLPESGSGSGNGLVCPAPLWTIPHLSSYLYIRLHVPDRHFLAPHPFCISLPCSHKDLQHRILHGVPHPTLKLYTVPRALRRRPEILDAIPTKHSLGLPQSSVIASLVLMPNICLHAKAPTADILSYPAQRGHRVSKSGCHHNRPCHHCRP